MAADGVTPSVNPVNPSSDAFAVTCSPDFTASASSQDFENRRNVTGNNGSATKPCHIRIQSNVQEVRSGIFDSIDNRAQPSIQPAMSSFPPPPGDRALPFDAFFVHHPSQREWVFGVMERLESSPSAGLRCLSVDQDDDPSAGLSAAAVDEGAAAGASAAAAAGIGGSTLFNRIHDGARRSRRTLVVLSPEFLSDVWISVADMTELTSGEEVAFQRRRRRRRMSNITVLMVRRCDVPDALFDADYIDVEADDWWTKLVAQLRRSDDTPQTGMTNLSSFCSPGSPDDSNDISLHNGRLLTSLRSRCRCCCKEVIDVTDLPNELLVCGVQIPVDEYSAMIDHLMSDSNFLCHVWCYNVPGAVVFFAVLLGFCLGVIPFAEVRWIYRRSQSGLEFVHAIVVWLCCLAVYMIVLNISKRKMKRSSYKKLTHVNRCLVKYNLLAGIENLGLADCNKYYLHFFYYDVGPCLAYLQETIVSYDETAFSRVVLGHSMSGLSSQLEGHLDSFSVEMETCDEHLSTKNDRLHVLTSNVITNASLQIKTEELIIQHSGQYLSLLISKKLERPRKSRHIFDRPCLCQYIEQHVCRLV